MRSPSSGAGTDHSAIDLYSEARRASDPVHISRFYICIGPDSNTKVQQGQIVARPGEGEISCLPRLPIQVAIRHRATASLSFYARWSSEPAHSRGASAYGSPTGGRQQAHAAT